MSSIVVRSTSIGRCEVLHEQSGARLTTDMPPEYGGEGRSFSATDLLAAALGVCVATNVDLVADRHGVPIEALEVRVEKTLAASPKRVSALAVTITIAAEVGDDVVARLDRAAAHCAVHRSLHPEVDVTIRTRRRA